MRTADRELVDMLTEQPPTRSPISTASLGARLSLDRSSTLSAQTGSISLVVGQSHQDPNTLKAEALRKRANSKTMRFRRAGSEMPHAERPGRNRTTDRSVQNPGNNKLSR